MTSISRLFAAATAIAVLAFSAPGPAAAQNMSAPQRAEIESIVKEYLISHPEVIQEALGELEKRQTAAEAEKHQAAVQDNAQILFSSNRQVVLGNPQGDITMVEFFDYNCGFC
jgi:protein-disulfide isomerase